MKSSSLLAASMAGLSLLAPISAALAAADDANFTITKLRVEKVSEGELPIHTLPLVLPGSRIARENFAPVLGLAASSESPGEGGGGISLGGIINIGKELWDIIKSNRPVANLKTDMATALPITPVQVSQWKKPKYVSYRIVYENGLGTDVVSFNYTLYYTYGGSVKGKGQYLTNVTILPGELSVIWGFTFNAQVSALNATNVGTEKNPLGALQLVLSWTVESHLKLMQHSKTYLVRGDGTFVDLNPELGEQLEL